MRLQLTLNHRPNQVLPINYQYLISSWIYHTLGNANEAFATQLHNHGYDFRGKQYKLFTFGPLRPAWFDLDGKNRTFTLAKSPTTLELSFNMDEAMQHFVMGLFKNQRFQLKSGQFEANFEVVGIELQAKPSFQENMRFRLTTPLCLSRKIEGMPHADYMPPEESGYGSYLVKNLLHKQLAIQSQVAGVQEVADEVDFPFNFKLCSKPKPKLFRIKGIDLKGYLFDFELRAPVDLMELGYFAGFGEKGSGVGFGMGLILK